MAQPHKVSVKASKTRSDVFIILATFNFVKRPMLPNDPKPAHGAKRRKREFVTNYNGKNSRRSFQRGVKPLVYHVVSKPKHKEPRLAQSPIVEECAAYGM